jgi:hypothetical protein
LVDPLPLLDNAEVVADDGDSFDGGVVVGQIVL